MTHQTVGTVQGVEATVRVEDGRVGRRDAERVGGLAGERDPRPRGRPHTLSPAGTVRGFSGGGHTRARVATHETPHGGGHYDRRPVDDPTARDDGDPIAPATP